MESLIILIILPILVGIIVKINNIHKYILLTMYVFFVSMIILSSITMDYAIESNIIRCIQTQRQQDDLNMRKYNVKENQIIKIEQHKEKYIEDDNLSNNFENQKTNTTPDYSKQIRIRVIDDEKLSELDYWKNQKQMLTKHKTNLYKIENNALKPLKQTYKILKNVKNNTDTIENLIESAKISSIKCKESVNEFEKLIIDSRFDETIKDKIIKEKQDLQLAYYIRQCAINHGIDLVEKKKIKYAFKIKKEFDMADELIFGCRTKMKDIMNIIEENIIKYIE